jgi:hypothetical protein
MKRRRNADNAQISESVAKESLAESPPVLPPANRALIEATVVALLALLFFLYVGLEAGLAKKTHAKNAPKKSH